MILLLVIIYLFDEKYIYDRCNKILDLKRIHYISKLDEYKSPFKEIKLASSALGENLLRFLIHLESSCRFNERITKKS